MHSIERYGIVALLFLVVTVVAVLMWDGGKDKKKEAVPGTTATPAATHRPLRPGAEERQAARRLTLAAEPQPGPLTRTPKRRTGESGTEPETLPATSSPLSGAAPLEPDAAGGRPSTDAQPPGMPRQQPARDPIVGRSQPEATHAYVVRSGDTLSEIAQHELGSARRWQEIVAANPGLEPEKLRAGKTIQIPGAQAPTAARGTSVPAKPQAEPARAPAREARTWTVGKGENLWKIAARALGDGKRWPEIAALNPRANPDRLAPGQVLTLPASDPRKKTSAAAKPVGERSTLVASTAGERTAPRGGKVR